MQSKEGNWKRRSNIYSPGNEKQLETECRVIHLQPIFHLFIGARAKTLRLFYGYETLLISHYDSKLPTSVCTTSILVQEGREHIASY